jgi:hypothetical protein|tara:strand:- start:394 stop:645 length:252 start_codon:yes stop_codon:yes gene_type:complete
VQIQHEITESERKAVKRHLASSDDRLSFGIINKMLSKYEITLQNKLTEITNLKMDLDDRDIAVDLFFRKKLKSEDVKNLIKIK